MIRIISFLCLSLLAAPALLWSGEDINERFGLSGDGRTDDTRAFQKALRELSQKGGTLRLGTGTFLISDSLKLSDGVCLCGDGADKTLIKLKDGRGKAALSIRGKYAPNEICVSNLTIEGAGKAGLSFSLPAEARASVKNVCVNGFDFGATVTGRERGVTFEDLTLSDQRVAGVKNDDGAVTIKNIVCHIAASAIISTGKHAELKVDHAELTGGAQENFAIIGEGSVILREVSTSGYRAALKYEGEAVDRINIDEFGK